MSRAPKDPTMILYGSQYSAIKILSDENKGVLLDALFRYILNEEDKDAILSEIASEGVRITFVLLTNQIDLDKQKYADKCAINKRIAEEREKARKNTDVHERERTCTNVSKRTHKDKDNDNDNDKNTSNDVSVIVATSDDALQKRADKFYNSLVPYVRLYGKDMVREFYNYWTEPNKSGTKMRYELEKTWDAKRRLTTWANRQHTFSARTVSTNSEEARQQRTTEAADIIARLAAEDDAEEEKKQNKSIWGNYTPSDAEQETLKRLMQENDY